MLTLVDEYTRECPSIDVARNLRSDDVLERLSWLFATRGVPKHIRSDNGPEFTASVVRDWLKRVAVQRSARPSPRQTHACLTHQETVRKAVPWRKIE
jgi:transposase InsO family protein